MSSSRGGAEPVAASRRGRYAQFFDTPDSDAAASPDASARPSRGANEPDKESALDQQSMGAWYPVRSPSCVIITLLTISLAALAIGICILVLSAEYVIEQAVRYDHRTPEGCPADPNKCRLMLDVLVERDMPPPVFFYYRLDGFYQNYRLYAQSRSDEQFYGEHTKELSSCAPLERWGEKRLYPCGLIANSYFNDTFDITGSGGTPVNFTDDDIVWSTDRQKYTVRPLDPALNETDVGPGEYALPKPGDPHMSQWLRVGAMSSFRKLHRVSTEHGLTRGQNLTVQVHSYFPAAGAEKWVVFATTSVLGGSQLYLAWLYIICGALGTATGVLLACLARGMQSDHKRYFYAPEEAYDGVGDGLDASSGVDGDGGDGDGDGGDGGDGGDESSR